MAVLRNEIEAKGATLSHTEAEKFARKAGVTERRKRIREALKALGGSSTTGPRHPEKKAGAFLSSPRKRHQSV
jgi:hypothetical protein